MHTNFTVSKEASTQESICGRHHRHWVAMPLFVVLGCASLSPALVQLPAPQAAVVSVHAAAEQQYSFGNGMWGIALPGASVQGQEETVLQEGSILTASDGVVRVRASDALITSVRGELHVTLDAGMLTVAALNAPAAIRFGSGTVILLSGRQTSLSLQQPPEGSVADAIALPSDLVREYRQELHAARPVLAPTPPVIRAGDLRNTQEESEALATLRRAARHITNQAFAEATLAMAELQTMTLPVGAGEMLLEHALRATDVPPSLLASVLALHADDTLLLLSRLDPVLRDAAWSLPGASIQAIELFPLSDTAPDAAIGFTVLRWHAEAALALQEAEDPQETLTRIIAASRPAAETCSRLGYPDRKARYNGVLQALSEPFMSELDADTLATLDLWKEEAVVLEDLPSENSGTAPAEVQPEVSVLPADPALLVSQAERLLDAAGALRTVESRFQAVSEGVVHVAGIFFAAPDGDHLYEFDLDLPAKKVRGIRKDDSAAMPLPMQWEAFLGWVQGK